MLAPRALSFSSVVGLLLQSPQRSAQSVAAEGVRGANTPVPQIRPEVSGGPGEHGSNASAGNAPDKKSTSAPGLTRQQTLIFIRFELDAPSAAVELVAAPLLRFGGTELRFSALRSAGLHIKQFWAKIKFWRPYQLVASRVLRVA